jgi:hypothetical protein
LLLKVLHHFVTDFIGSFDLIRKSMVSLREILKGVLVYKELLFSEDEFSFSRIVSLILKK